MLGRGGAVLVGGVYVGEVPVGRCDWVLGGGPPGRPKVCPPDGCPDGGGVLGLFEGDGAVLCCGGGGAGFLSLSFWSVWASRLAPDTNTKAAIAARIQRLGAAARGVGCTNMATIWYVAVRPK